MVLSGMAIPEYFLRVVLTGMVRDGKYVNVTAKEFVRGKNIGDQGNQKINFNNYYKICVG